MTVLYECVCSDHHPLLFSIDFGIVPAYGTGEGGNSGNKRVIHWDKLRPCDINHYRVYTVRVSQIQKSGEAVKWLTDWPQIWHTSADPSGNGYTRNKLPFKTQVGTLVGYRCQTFKSLEKLSNGWTDWHQISYTSADTSGNGHRLNAIRPTIPHGHFGEGFKGSQMKMFGEAVKRLDRLVPNLVQICGSVWEST